MTTNTISNITGFSNYQYWLILFVVGFGLYANTLTHDYALDDAIVITKNEFTRQGIKGIPEILTHDSFTGFFGEQKDLVTGGRYRPLSMVMFAIEYELFGLNPFIGHLINVLLYCLLGCVLFQLLLKFAMQSFQNQRLAVLFAFISSLFFIAHPVHTEVVANIKGRDEILALLLGLFTLHLTLKSIEKKAFYMVLCASLLYFLALLSKENAAVFLIIIPITIYLFGYYDIRKSVIHSLPLFLVFIIYIILRVDILGELADTSNELMNNPFAGALPREKAGTILFTLGYYLRLLIFPHPLTYDYYPFHIELTNLFSAIPIIVFFVYIALFVVLFVTLKKGNFLSYGLLWYILPLIPISNIFFPIGVFMGERFVFFSSVGYCLILGLFFSKYLYDKWVRQKEALIIAIIILALYGFKTVDRNQAWKDDFTLFTTDVKTSQNSAKANTTAGGAIYEKALNIEDSQEKRVMLHESKHYLQKAIRIYPGYVDAQLLLGNVQWELFYRFDSVWPHYSVILKKSPGHNETLDNMKAMATQLDGPKRKINILRKLHQYRPTSYDINYMLGSTFGKGLQMLDSARHYLQQAVDINPKPEALKDLGVAYGMSGEPGKAIQWFEEALAKDTTDRQLYINLGVSYRQLGNLEKAQEYFRKAERME